MEVKGEIGEKRQRTLDLLPYGLNAFDYFVKARGDT